MIRYQLITAYFIYRVFPENLRETGGVMGNFRCFLCGGRVSGGVCTECGMPQRRHAENYKLNESECEQKPLTHVHDSEDTREKTPRADRSDRKSYAETQRRLERRKSAGKGNRAIFVIPVAIVFLFIAFPAIKNQIDSGGFGWDRTDETEYDYNDTTYDIPADGEVYTTELSPGCYTVGYDLPEGQYDLALIYGDGSLNIANDEQFIYRYEILGGEQGVTQLYAVPLYQGTQIQISGGAELSLSTENAQVDKWMEKEPNVLPSEMAVIVTDTALVAGTDFPAGTYDLYCIGDFCAATVSYVGEAADSYYYEQVFLVQSEEDAAEYGRMESYAVCVRNVALTDGMSVFGDGTDLMLTPSDTVVPTENGGDTEFEFEQDDIPQEGEYDVEYY